MESQGRLAVWNAEESQRSAAAVQLSVSGGNKRPGVRRTRWDRPDGSDGVDGTGGDGGGTVTMAEGRCRHSTYTLNQASAEWEPQS